MMYNFFLFKLKKRAYILCGGVSKFFNILDNVFFPDRNPQISFRVRELDHDADPVGKGYVAVITRPQPLCVWVVTDTRQGLFDVEKERRVPKPKESGKASANRSVVVQKVAAVLVDHLNEAAVIAFNPGL